MPNNTQPDSLKGITLVKSYVKDEKHFAFVGQRFPNEDAWEDVLTYVIFYFADKPLQDRWLVHELDYMTDTMGVTGVWCEKPEPQWLFGYTNTGYMLTFDANGQQTGTEQQPKYYRPSSNEVILNPAFYSMAAVQGSAFIVLFGRIVYKRSQKNVWTLLNNGFPALDYYGYGDEDGKDERLLSAHGFNGIAGFSESDLYACGGYGDLWHYDGQQWQQVDIPTNALLECICCGDDGLVYIATNANTVLVGRGDSWEVTEPSPSSSTIESIHWYHDRCYFNTAVRLFEVRHGKVVESSLHQGMPSIPSCIGARGNILLIASRSYSRTNEVSYYDGHEWHRVMAADQPASPA